MSDKTLSVPDAIVLRDRPPGWLAALRAERLQARLDYRKSKVKKPGEPSAKRGRTGGPKKSQTSLLSLMTPEMLKAAGFNP